MEKIDTLVIIGNGFDIWQNIKTQFSEFEKYYNQHKYEIIEKLKIPRYTCEYNSRKYNFTDVELIFGDPFEPYSLDTDFWNTFESSLADIDSYNINLYFGKSKNDLKLMKKSMSNAGRILKEAFCRWILSLKIENLKSKFRFKKNCFFINFNYTDTLSKRFGVDEDNICYIHGQAKDKDSIVFGHSFHPEEPNKYLYQLKGRFKGLYLIENMLYACDKHVRDNITCLAMELSLSLIKPEDIKHIYVLGHSFGSVDFEYFKYLKSITSVNNELYKEEDELKKLKIPENPYLRIQYSVMKYGKDLLRNQKIPYELEMIVKNCYLKEQAKRDEFIIKEYLDGLFSVFDIDKRNKKHYQRKKTYDFNKHIKKRKKDAKWHISYFSDTDKKHIKKVMKMLKCKDYELFNSIDETIKPIIIKKEN